MKRIILLILAMFIFIGSANAFFVGFGSAGGVEQVIKKGQEQGVISKIPGETTPGGGETTPGPVQHGAEVVWQKTWDDGIQRTDYAKGIAVDKYGNVYVTGHITDNCLTIKYDTNGNKIWQEKYDSGWYECGCGITVDDTGNVYVTGSSVTIKYNSIGDTVWQKNNSGYGIAVDSSGNVYVTGTSNEDYLTIKYNGTNGDTIWQKVYNGGNADYSQGIAVDSSGNVYVTGYSWNGTDCDYLTTKYCQY